MSLPDFERSLLASGASDAPSAERRAAARAAVVTGAAVGVAAAASTTAATTVTKLFTIVKALAVVVIGTAATAVVMTTRPAAPLPKTISPATGAHSRVVRAAGAIRPATPLPEIHVDALPQADAPPAAAAPSPRAGSSTSEEPLAVEARTLEAARACLAARDLACTKARLDEHRTRFPSGTLADEATILEIDLAVAEGRVDRARTLARDLLSRHPDGPWTARVRRLAREAE